MGKLRGSRNRRPNALPIPSRRTSLPSSERALPAEGPKGIFVKDSGAPVGGQGTLSDDGDLGTGSMPGSAQASQFSPKGGQSGPQPLPSTFRPPASRIGDPRGPAAGGKMSRRKRTPPGRGPVATCPSPGPALGARSSVLWSGYWGDEDSSGEAGPQGRGRGRGRAVACDGWGLRRPEKSLAAGVRRLGSQGRDRGAGRWYTLKAGQ